jgi:hypothetical protein
VVAVAMLPVLLQALGCVVNKAQPEPIADISEPTQAADDPHELDLDALIDRLPPIGSETVYNGERWELRPLPAEMKSRVEGGAKLTGEQWKRALLRTGALRIRTPWALPMPAAVSMRVPAWLDVTRIRMVPWDRRLNAVEVGSLVPETCGTYATWCYQDWMYQELGSLDLGRHRIQFDVNIERGEDVWLKHFPKEGVTAPPPGLVWQGAMEFELEVVPTWNDAIPPTSTPALDRAVGQSISVAFDDWAHGRTAILVVDPNRLELSSLANVGLSLNVELWKGAQLMETLPMIPSTYDPIAQSISVAEDGDRSIAFSVLKSLPLSLETDREARRAWFLRVHGTGDRVWALWGAENRWSGTIDVPLDDLIERERALAPKGRVWVWSPLLR